MFPDQMLDGILLQKNFNCTVFAIQIALKSNNVVSKNSPHRKRKDTTYKLW